MKVRITLLILYPLRNITSITVTKKRSFSLFHWDTKTSGSHDAYRVTRHRIVRDVPSTPPLGVEVPALGREPLHCPVRVRVGRKNRYYLYLS